MRKLSKILVLVLALAMLTVVFATTVSAAAGETWTVAGSSALCGSNWSTTDTKNDMTYDSATDSYVKVYYNVKAGNYEFKCAKNHAWGTAYPGSNYNLKVEKDGSTVTITLKGTNVTAKVEAPACDHAYEVTAATVTCLTSGSRTWTCSKCQDTYTENLEALGHHYDATGKCERCDETTTLVRVYVENAAKWADVYCYTWDTNPYVAWPGEKMQLDSESGLYYYDIPKHFVNVIFNNGSGTQSADLKTPTGTATIYNNSTKTWKAPHVCSFSEATCITLATCSCGKTQGELAEHDMVAGEVVAPTYSAEGYTVYTCSVCGATEKKDATDKLVPAFPEAVVTPIEGKIDEDITLTFALNFGIKGVSIVDGEIVLDETIITEEYIAAVLETYGRMYVDYRLTISGLSDPSVTLNSDGTADGFLGGQYDAWSENWVCVPFGDSVVIENGKSLMIMEYAAELMGQAGLRMILEEIVTVVIDFDCGVYFTPEFMEHNPDMKVTLELLVFNEDANGELTDVIVVAENIFTVPHTHSHSAVVTAPTCTEAGYTTYTCDCGDTYVADEVGALGHDYKNGGKCADCEAVPANDYLINFSEWRPFDKATFADGDTVKYNDIFTFIYGKNSRVDASAKTWDDLSATLRFSLGGKTNSGVPTKNAIQITVDGAYTLKVWYVAGGDARYFALVDAEGNVLSETTKETVKNGQYYAELAVPAAGVYYLTIPADNNYIFQLELVEVPHVHTWVDATCTAPKTCSGCGATEGEVASHTYFYMNCLACGAANPHFIYNFTTVGENKLVCNEYHLVDTDTHKKPYQFTLVTIPEDGLYIFTADATKLGVFIYTIEINTEGADFSVGGASWAAVTFGQAELKAGQYYLGFIFHEGVGEYDLTITKHEHEFVEGNCACGAEDPNYVPPHEHEFVEGKCECGETDPDYVAPEEPKDDDSVVELTFFQKILAWFKQLVARIIAIFKK